MAVTAVRHGGHGGPPWASGPRRTPNLCGVRRGNPRRTPYAVGPRRNGSAVTAYAVRRDGGHGGRRPPRNYGGGGDKY